MTQQARPCLLVQLSKGIITMATHDIKFSIPEKDLGNVDTSFSIKEDGKQLGTLDISKGGVDWYPKNAKVAKSFSWSKLAELLNERNS